MKIVWKVVPDERRAKTPKYDEEMLAALRLGKTLEVEEFDKASNHYRVAREAGYTLRTRKDADGKTLLWYVARKEKEGVVIEEIAVPEGEKV